MKFDTSFWMMVAFIAGLVLSAWKLYMFVPSKQLKDDDTTKESQNELLELILKLIKESDEELNEKELHNQVKSHKDFNAEHFWRFNENKLRQLLHIHYSCNPDTKCIKDIHKKLNSNELKET